MRKLSASCLSATFLFILTATATAGGGRAIFGTFRADSLFGTDGDDRIFLLAGDDFVDAKLGNDRVRGNRGDDVLLGGGGYDILRGGPGNDKIDGGADDDTIVGGRGEDDLAGGSGVDHIDGGPHFDAINGNAEADVLVGGAGPDRFAFDGDAFDGADVSAPGRQIIGNEDSIEDFDFDDELAFTASDFAVKGALTFASLDANASGAFIAEGANVIVLVNADNDGDPTTPFLAGTAANQIATLVSRPGAGFFVYFNSNLQLNRVVYSTDLSDASADLKIVARLTAREGQSAIGALPQFTAANFVFVGDELRGDDDSNELNGFGGVDIIDGADGDDELRGRGAGDTLTGGAGHDAFVVDGLPFDGADVSAAGRQIVGNEDFIADYEIGVDRTVIVAADFGLSSTLGFVSIDGNVGGTIAAGTNVVVLTNADNDNDPSTPFLAGTAAAQLAPLVSQAGPGFFLYFNSNLQLNRLVYSTDLSSASADLKIINRLTDAVGQDAIDALSRFSAADFELR